MASCYVALRRRLGGEEDNTLTSKDRRDAIRHLKGTFSHTDQSTIDGFKWLDYYKVPITPPFTVNDMARYCRSKGIYDGPFHGTGRVLQPTGAGKVKPGQSARLLREKVKAIQETGSAGELLYLLFGDSQAVGWLARVNAQELQDYPLPASWEDNQVKEWFRLNRTNPQFHAIYTLVRSEVCRLQQEMMTGQPYDELLLIWWQQREAIIGRWVAWTLSKKPTFTGAGKQAPVEEAKSYLSLWCLLPDEPNPVPPAPKGPPEPISPSGWVGPRGKDKLDI